MSQDSDAQRAWLVLVFLWFVTLAGVFCLGLAIGQKDGRTATLREFGYEEVTVAATTTITRIK